MRNERKEEKGRVKRRRDGLLQLRKKMKRVC